MVLLVILLLLVAPSVGGVRQCEPDGEAIPRGLVSADFGPEVVLAADIDGDGFEDMVYAAENADKVGWYRWNPVEGAFEGQRVVTLVADGVEFVAAGDCDGDGDLDLVSASQVDEVFGWYENLDGNGKFGDRRIVATGANGARSVRVADIDGDGDMDLVTTARDEDTVAWYPNLDGAGTFGARIVISNSENSIGMAATGDVDGDGDPDVAWVIPTLDKLTWAENQNGSFGNLIVVTSSADAVRHVVMANVDADADLDMVTASYSDNRVAWYENVNGLGTVWTTHVVSTAVDGAVAVLAVDLDGDLDLDLVALAAISDSVSWFENTNGLGSFGPQQVLTSGPIDNPSWVCTADWDGDGDADLGVAGRNSRALYVLDNELGTTGTFAPPLELETPDVRQVALVDVTGDGDADVVVTDYEGGNLFWFENLDGAGTFGPQRLISNDTYLPRSVAGGDVNGDGRADVVASITTFSADAKVVWFENLDGLGAFGPRRSVWVTTASANLLTLTDLDGDSDLDILVLSESTNFAGWFNNTDGLGSFSPVITVSSSVDDPRGAAVADLDGDNDLDVALASSDDNTIAWHANLDGRGALFGPQNVVTMAARGATWVAAGDLDGDGDVDLASTSTLDDKVAWYENLNGTGAFGNQRIVSTRFENPNVVRMADVNGDGSLDLVAGFGDNSLAWYANTNGKGTFSEGSIVSTAGDTVVSLDVGDIDGDGDIDFITGSAGDDAAQWFVNGEGILGLSFGARTVVTFSVNTPRSAWPADLDRDGDLDIVVVDGTENNVVWYENENGLFAFGPENVVTTLTLDARDALAADVDGDGDLDIVSVSYSDDKIAWYENLDGAGSFGPQVVVSTSFDAPIAVFAGDIDGDGRMDLATASFEDDTVSWHRNVDGDGSAWVSTVANASVPGASSVFMADVDGDGNMDLVSASADADRIAWHRNVDGAGSVWDTVVVSTLAAKALSVFVADIDGDGDMDLASASADDDKIAWYENLDGTGAFGVQRVVSTVADGARSVFVADVDGDGDMDMVSASERDEKIAWYENVDGAGTFAPESVISREVNDAYDVFVADADGDGDMDVLAVAEGVARIDWFPQITRNAFHTFLPSSRAFPLSPTIPSCTLLNSASCLAFQVASTSRCVRDTLYLPPGRYTCPSKRAVSVTSKIRVEASVPGTVTFECDGGVLFSVTTEDSLVGDLQLVDLVITGTESGSDDVRATPGLRVDGSGAVLSLFNTTVTSGRSVSSPSLLGSGTGGCVLATGGGRLSVVDSEIANCSASDNGGALAGIGAGTSVEVIRSRVEENRAGLGGGGLAALAGASVVVRDGSVVEGNGATVGGGMYAEQDGSVIGVHDSVVLSNVATGSGGGVAVAAESSFVAFNARLVGNSGANVGGGIWIHPDAAGADVSQSWVEGNRAGAGGGVAVGEGAGVSATTPVSDIPRATAVAAEGVGEEGVLRLQGTRVVGNVALGVGGGVFVCDGWVEVEGGAVWEGNVAQRAGGRVSADAFLCALSETEMNGGGGFVVDRTRVDGIPWLKIESGLAWDLWALNGPVAVLEWVVSPEEALEAGETMTGSLRALDIFELPVVYSLSSVSVVLEDPEGALGGLEVPDVLLGEERVELPNIGLRVSEPSAIPARLSVVVDVVRNTDSGGLGVESLMAQVELGPCSVGRGGVVEAGLVSCVACSPGTESLELSLDPCVGLSVCPPNTLRLISNESSGAVPCVCDRGFWVPSGQENQECIPCPVGGVCPGGVVRPVAGPGFFPEEGGSTLFLACPNVEACQGNGACAPGYQGRLCAQCADGYYALRGKCYACNEGVNAAVTALLLLVVLGIWKVGFSTFPE